MFQALYIGGTVIILILSSGSLSGVELLGKSKAEQKAKEIAESIVAPPVMKEEPFVPAGPSSPLLPKKINESFFAS